LVLPPQPPARDLHERVELIIAILLMSIIKSVDLYPAAIRLRILFAKTAMLAAPTKAR
jgi:hypothetical protein